MKRSNFRKKFSPNKFKAKKTAYGDYVFDSKLESIAYKELQLMEKAKLIKNLETQKQFSLKVNDKQICVIIPDFFFFDTQKNKEVVAEAKGVETPEWRLKWKLLMALFPQYDYWMYKHRTGWYDYA